MISCQHLLENRVYLISCKSVESLNIFKNNSEKRKIRRTIHRYLEEVCQILHLEIRRCEFHLVVKIHDRIQIEDFYIKKYEGKVFEPFFIPESTHIFGRQMSNLLVSFVKSYNWKFNRKGILMDGRYRRFLIKSEDEMVYIIQCLKLGEYKVVGGEVKRTEHHTKRNEGIEKRNIRVEKMELEYRSSNKKNLRGCFKPPFRITLISPEISQKSKEFRANYPCGPNYN